MPLLTPQQQEAVYRRGTSVVLASGAGCGKTHVLTRRYLSHLTEDGAEVGQIVAITFTERAAREMRGRIRAEVVARLDAAPGEEEAARWETHLRGLETAQISTIHAFCAALLRQHAIEAGLDPSFDVLEDYLAANLEAEAVAECLQRLLTADTVAGRDLEDLVLAYGWKPVGEAVRHLLRDLDTTARAAWLQKNDTETVEQWQRQAEALLRQYAGYVTAAVPKVARCLWLLRTTPCHGPKMKANVRRVLEGVRDLAGAQELEAALDEVTEAARVKGTEGAKAWSSEEVYATVRDALEDLRKELPARLKLFQEAPEDLDRAAIMARRFVRVADEAAAAYRQRKRREGVVDFQDLLVRARDLLRDNAEVRERLQRRFRFLLIDELQDTDPVQIELAEHLCGAGLTAGKLFAVGDHSQSIYRFRGADVYLFRGLRRKVPAEGRLGLTLNFRSQPAVLDFVNALLGEALEDYEPLRAHRGQLSAGACVEFLWSPRPAKEPVGLARAREADTIARRLRALIDGGEALVDDSSGGLRPVQPGDVVLLFRSMTNVALYEAALRDQGLDYYLVGGRAFFAQQEVYDLLNLLRALENPQDAVSLAGALRSPFCCLSDEALFVLSRHPEGLWGGLHDPATKERLPVGQRPLAERARVNLGRWRAHKDRLPIARLLGEVFADSAYDAATQFEFLGDRKLANLWKLTDLARRFDRTGLFGLAQFIAYLGELVRAQPREEQAATQPEKAAEVVRLMTVHQAKGLEFPVVVVPDLARAPGESRLPAAHWDAALGCVVRPPNEDQPPFSDFPWRLWQAGEAVAGWREDLRTLYVACTRAEDYLLLSAALPEDFSPQSPWLLTLAERFDLKTGRCLLNEVPADRIPKVRVTNAADLPVRVASGEQTPGPSLALRAGCDTTTLISKPDFASPLVFTVGQLQDLLAGAADGVGGWQWDAEDGSDRSTWVRPGERIEASADLRERLLRAVLEGWEFADPEGWRPLLGRAIESLARPEAAAGLRAHLGTMLKHFAGSETAGRLARARACHREVEFLLPLDSADEEASAHARGVIDCLWQDEQGGWHVLAYATGPAPEGGPEQDWPRQRVGLVLAALAARQQLGAWPRTVGRYYLEEGTLVSRDGAHLPHQQILATLRTAVARRRAEEGGSE